MSMFPSTTLLARAARVAIVASLSGCSSTDKSAGPNTNADKDASPQPGLSAAAIADLQHKGVDKYIGKAKPVSHTDDNETTVYEFDAKDGPICLWGDSYRALVRDAKSENLVIYLEGGGACWTALCAANTKASSTIPADGILDSKATTNVVADWNVLYVPYCDGSVFSGDNELQAMGGPSGTTQTRYHHGIKNLTAALDLAKATFPNPKRILLAGSSAGGYGTIIGTAVTRLEYPHTDLIVFNDAGLGLTNPTDPTTYTQIKAEWKFDQFIPDSCTQCENGQQTALIGWGLRNDPTLKVAAFSSYGDAVIGGTFLQMQPADFKALLLEKTGAVHTEFPTRFERFFINGGTHTSLISNEAGATLWGYLTPAQGLSVSDFTTEFVNGSAAWVDHLESGDAGP
jgi:hypothetical protein